MNHWSSSVTKSLPFWMNLARGVCLELLQLTVHSRKWEPSFWNTQFPRPIATCSKGMSSRCQRDDQ